MTASTLSVIDDWYLVATRTDVVIRGTVFGTPIEVPFCLSRDSGGKRCLGDLLQKPLASFGRRLEGDWLAELQRDRPAVYQSLVQLQLV